MNYNLINSLQLCSVFLHKAQIITLLFVLYADVQRGKAPTLPLPHSHNDVFGY